MLYKDVHDMTEEENKKLFKGAVIIDELLNEASKNDPIYKQNILNFIERYLSKRTS